MKITAQTLETVKGELVKASSQLNDQTRVAKAAEDTRVELAATVRGLQGAFDVCAASYAQDVEMSSAQLNDLPVAVQTLLGYGKKAAPEEKAVEER